VLGVASTKRLTSVDGGRSRRKKFILGAGRLFHARILFNCSQVRREETQNKYNILYIFGSGGIVTYMNMNCKLASILLVICICLSLLYFSLHRVF
jgi:predicted permease